MNSGEMQQAISEEVNSRQAKAIEEIQEKYASGKGGVENSVDAPTGSAYMEKYEADKAARKARRAANENEDVDFNKREQQYTNEDDVPEDDDADYELRQIRQARLKEIKNSHRQKVEDIAKGHGQYREITQDDFIAEVTSSYRVVCHFYHRDFPKCEIMHYHIGKIVKTHMETKFIKINAEKSLFFVDKLKIRSMPTVVLFFDGVAKDKIIGFEGLADDLPEGKEDEWSTIQLQRLLASKDAVHAENIVDEDRIVADAQAAMQSMRSTIFSNLMAQDDYDLDNLSD